MNTPEFRFVFHAHDYDKSVAFYRDSLNMEVVSSWDRADSKGTLLRASESTIIEIFGAPQGDPPFDYPPADQSGMSLAFRVENVEGLHQQLLDSSAEITEPPTQKPWGHYSVKCKDPDGLPITLFELRKA